MAALSQIIGTRNALTHGYHLIDDEMVREAILKALPIPRPEIEKLLP